MPAPPPIPRPSPASSDRNHSLGSAPSFFIRAPFFSPHTRKTNAAHRRCTFSKEEQTKSTRHPLGSWIPFLPAASSNPPKPAPLKINSFTFSVYGEQPGLVHHPQFCTPPPWMGAVYCPGRAELLGRPQHGHQHMDGPSHPPRLDHVVSGMDRISARAWHSRPLRLDRTVADGAKNALTN